MYKLFLFIGFFLIAALWGCEDASQERYLLESPNGQTKIGLVSADGSIQYFVLHERDTVIRPSDLQMITDNGRVLTEIKLGAFEQTVIDETYPTLGKRASARNHGNQGILPFAGEDVEGELQLRAYNEGVAFRLSIRFEDSVDLIRDHVEMDFKDSLANIWGGDRGVQADPFDHSYEMVYEQYAPGQWTDSSFFFTPLAFRTSSGKEGIITEADVMKYPHMYLKPVKNGFESLNTPLPGRNVLLEDKKEIKTPWRVIMIDEKLLDLVESDMITNLAPPSKVSDQSWINPGMAVWDWWNDYNVDVPNAGKNQETMKAYIDFAADQGFEYMLVDAFWYGDERDTTENITTAVPEMDIPALVKYASQRQVGVHLWVNWKNLQNQYEEAIPLYESWGVKGIKVDFMQRDDAEIGHFYEDILTLAAKHHLMVNFHAAYKPTGLRRTYPNLLTREAVLGLEYYKWNDYAGPEHAVTLPFIRMVIGPMDFTPGGFDQVSKENFEARLHDPMVLGTRAHQLAMFVVYESPMQVIADDPGSLLSGQGLDFIREVPTVWDETIALDGHVGEYILLARKQGLKWYLGGMTDWTKRKLSVPLDFLDDGKYDVSVWKDGSDTSNDPRVVEKENLDGISSSDKLSFTMAPGGGFVAVIEPHDD